MNIVALICARSGSKGVPNKNIKLLAGKPLIVRSINQIKELKEINRVIVSTDSEEIAKIAINAGADIVCYLLGRLIYAAYVPQQYLGLCPFWLLCINSSPSYGYCLLSKNNIHP